MVTAKDMCQPDDKWANLREILLPQVATSPPKRQLDTMLDSKPGSLLKPLSPPGLALVEHLGNAEHAPQDHRYAGTIQHAVLKRRHEFMAGRACAHAALAALGENTDWIGQTPSGAPEWPGGVRGSITHCTGYVAAATDSTARLEWLGIDAEVAEPMSQSAAAMVAFGPERDWITQGPLNGRILFSAKEAVFKAWHPVRQTKLDFADAELTFDTKAQTFTARLKSDPPMALHGHWIVSNGLIGTLIAHQ